MSGFYLAFALTVLGMLLYHLAQKAVPQEANPFFVIAIAYAVGIALCLAFAFTYPGRKSLGETFRGANWAVFALGAAAARSAFRSTDRSLSTRRSDPCAR